jgi:hypothetical protein
MACSVPRLAPGSAQLGLAVDTGIASIYLMNVYGDTSGRTYGGERTSSAGHSG